MDNNSRNELVMRFHGHVRRTIYKNKTLLIALGIEEKDAYQDLMMVVMDAIDKFDPSRCDCLDKHVNAKLRFGILRMKRKHKPHGVVGKEARRLEYFSIDAFDSEYLSSEDNTYRVELNDAFENLTPAERNIVKQTYAGFAVYRKSDRETLNSGREKLRRYYRDGSNMTGERPWAV